MRLAKKGGLKKLLTINPIVHRWSMIDFFNKNREIERYIRIQPNSTDETYIYKRYMQEVRASNSYGVRLTHYKERANGNVEYHTAFTLFN
jgi:hypothetical protein